MGNIHIEQYIPKGKENAVTRVGLTILSGLDDRTIRQHIQLARRSGVPICNAQDGNGYYIPTLDELDDAKAQYRQEKKRAMTILKANKGLAKWIADAERGVFNE